MHLGGSAAAHRSEPPSDCSLPTRLFSHFGSGLYPDTTAAGCSNYHEYYIESSLVSRCAPAGDQTKGSLDSVTAK